MFISPYNFFLRKTSTNNINMSKYTNIIMLILSTKFTKTDSCEKIPKLSLREQDLHKNLSNTRG